VATSGGLGSYGAAAKASAAKTVPAKGQGIGAAAKASAASAASTMAPTNEGHGGASLSSSNKGELDLDAILDILGPCTLASPKASGRAKWKPASRPAYGPTGAGKTHTMMGSSEDAGEVGLETDHDLLVQIRSIFQRFDGGGALASVDARRDAAISDIGLAHDIAANKISELRGLLKANSQLDVLNLECSAVLRSGGVVCTHYTENHDTIHDERAKRTLFLRRTADIPRTVDL